MSPMIRPAHLRFRHEVVAACLAWTMCKASESRLMAGRTPYNSGRILHQSLAQGHHLLELIEGVRNKASTTRFR